MPFLRRKIIEQRKIPSKPIGTFIVPASGKKVPVYQRTNGQITSDTRRNWPDVERRLGERRKVKLGIRLPGESVGRCFFTPQQAHKLGYEIETERTRHFLNPPFEGQPKRLVHHIKKSDWQWKFWQKELPVRMRGKELYWIWNSREVNERQRK